MKEPLSIRDETPADYTAVHDIIVAAFAGKPYSHGTEKLILSALREQNAVSVALVALDSGVIVGQVTFSPITIDAQSSDWHALGPVSVHPSHQGRGIGSRLIREGLGRLRAQNSDGCILLGNPNYYRRFGFRSTAELHVLNAPQEHLQILPFIDVVRTGLAAFHEAFQVKLA